MSEPDSSHIASLLLLAVHQLEAAMQDASAEAELLSHAIASLGERGAQMRDTGGESTQAKALPILADAQRAMRALQFHDRLSQRVSHVRGALAQMHASLASGQNVQWEQLSQTIRDGFTMESECRLFDTIVTRKLSEPESEPEAAPSGGVELF